MLAVVAVPAAEARTRHSDAWARQHFAAAERMREALNGRPSEDRTRRDYQRVLNAYRNVYLGAPASSKADPSVVAVAETLVEMGRRFDDNKILNAAIEQYRFLRQEYPGSKYRVDGLFTIGEIYKEDLNDPVAARTTFQDFLQHYPNNRLADDARQAMAELEREVRNGQAKNGEAKNSASEKLRRTPEPTGDAAAVGASKIESSPKNDETDGEEDAEFRQGGRSSTSKDSTRTTSGQLARVTGIRHWSTPDYTRVAIDVEGNVKFSSRRISSPARIFFDLPNTRLASVLVGKSFDVDDGFLKRVRVAQFAPGRTRVVLEVDNLSDYNAFLLPNPYRLIIDIHGKNRDAKGHANESTALAAANEVAKPEVSEDDSGTLAGAAENTAADDTTTENLSSQPAGITPIPARTTSSGVVKKIVEADDEDDNSNAGAERRNLHGQSEKVTSSRKALASKKIGSVESDGVAELPDSKSSEVAENNSHPHGRSSSHSLSTGRLASSSDQSVREARPMSSGDRSLIRALGLKIGKIVIDPGHGGHDTGTIGPDGLEEKDLDLDVGRRLGKLLETRLGAEVVYTRKDDTFIPLETRTAIANQARADLFVSIHANSSHDSAARGVETYYLNFTSSPEALEVAARENAVSEQSIYELQDLVKKIALKEKIEESREFAWDVQQSLHSGLAAKSPAIRDRGVKKAPFIVLIGANMPSILAEISFVSNPTDERRLATSEYRQRIAESLYRGIAKYVNGLSGVKVASKMDKGAGQ